MSLVAKYQDASLEKYDALLIKDHIQPTMYNAWTWKKNITIKYWIILFIIFLVVSHGHLRNVNLTDSRWLNEYDWNLWIWPKS